MKGYKAFTTKLTCCNGFQYEVGKTYEMDGEIKPCERGFHFCKCIADCYRFYDMRADTRICEIEAIGDVKTDDGIKFVTNKITIIAEITEDHDRKGNISASSSGYCNSGNWNSGDWNSGDWNSGNRNSGNGNSGNGNLGDGNSGSRNSGDRNSGDGNSGDENSGNGNSGNGNSGDWNSGDRNSGNGNLGDGNSGNRNSGGWNSGDRNSGNGNLGDGNSGNRNSGDGNSGDENSGNGNSGNGNSGNWNITNYSSGCFCTEDPKMLLFDKPTELTMQEFIYTTEYNILITCPFGNYSDGKELKLYTADDRRKWWNDLSVERKDLIKSLPNFDWNKFTQCMQMI